jgi:hypothetical protein
MKGLACPYLYTIYSLYEKGVPKTEWYPLSVVTKELSAAFNIYYFPKITLAKNILLIPDGSGGEYPWDLFGSSAKYDPGPQAQLLFHHLLSNPDVMIPFSPSMLVPLIIL